MLLLLAADFIFAGGEHEASATKFEKQSLNFGGSSTVLPIMEEAIEAYQKLHPEITISYEAPGSSAGIKGVMDGTYSLGGSSRKIKDPEAKAGVNKTTISLDGLAVVVNGKVTSNSLSLKQIAEIFAGKITNWKQVGGPDMKIILINRDEASGTRATFQELVLDHVIGKGGKFDNAAIIVESNGDMVTKVGTTPYSIGYCGFGYIDRAKSSGAQTVTIDGVTPETKNVYNHTYPLSRELFVVHMGSIKAGSVEEDFVKFLLSKDGQKIVKNVGYIPLP